MLRVTPIGSCRIAGPLQRAQDRLGIATHKGRVYGYCHSSGEAVQMARFLQGNFKPDPVTWPLISRGTSLAALSAQTHDPSDLYLVELSSAKRLTVDGVFVQLNYVTNAFSEFFADENRARAFWVRAEDGNQLAIDRFLAKIPMLDTDRRMLRSLRLSFTTPEELRADIASLQALLPRLLIVTHANARKPNGMPIGTRAAFINDVKEAAHAVGVRVYDPTKRMLEMGQTVALADHSAGLAHYSDSFADALCDDWVDVAIAPAIDDLMRGSDAQAVNDVLVPHIAALNGRVPFATLLNRLSNLAKSGAPVATLATALEISKRDIDPNEDPAQRAYLLGQFADVAKILSSAKTMPAPHVLLAFAQDAPESAAIEILSLGLAGHPDSKTLADRLALRLLDQDAAALTPVSNKLRAVLLGHIAPLHRAKLCIAYGWELSRDTQDMSPDDLTEVMAHLAVVQGRSAVLSFLEHLRFGDDLPVALSELLGGWCVCDTSSRADMVQLCQDVLAIDSKNTGARLALRDMRRLIRTDMRRLAESTDRAGLDELAQLNALLPDPLPEVDLFRARVCFRSGDYAEAITIGRSAAEVLPDNISIWVLLMRAAHKAQQSTLSARFAEKVLALATPDTARFAKEAEARVGCLSLVSHD